MNELALIRHLSKHELANDPAPKKVAGALGLSEDAVKAAQKKINSDGFFKVNSGRGGGLSITGGAKKEAELYGYIDALIERWVRQHIFGHFGVDGIRTRATHARRLDGKWSTPDFSTLCVKKYVHAPGSGIELVTFEVKHCGTQFDVTAVYEALAHTRVASYGMLFFYDDPANSIEDQGMDKVLEEIRTECAKLGIGLIVSQYPCDISTWQYLIPVRRHEPDLRRVDAFVDVAFEKEDKDWLAKLL